MTVGAQLISLVMMACLGTIALGSDSGEAKRTFVRALEQFDAAKEPSDFLGVAQELESIVESGFQSGAVYYNLGNAYFRAGEYGRAILNYRKAKPYLPRDPYLKANLQQAIAAAPGRLKAIDPPWWSPFFFWSNWFSYPSRVTVCFVLFCLTPFLLLLAFLLGKSYLRWGGIAIGLLSIVFGVEIGVHYAEEMCKDQAVITAETTARKGTGENYEAAFDQPLRDGAEFRVLDRTQHWTLGHFEGVGDGWVRNEFIAR